METVSFDKKERNDIAEYVYSCQHDILIKNDAIKLIDVFDRHNQIEDAKKWKDAINKQVVGMVSKLNTLIEEKIPIKQMREIMDEYYGAAKKDFNPEQN